MWDIVVENCVVWGDWGHCLEIGAECCAAHMRILAFRNIDVIRGVASAMNIGNVDYGHVHDVLFENIRVEMDKIYQRPLIQKSDITFRNIRVLSGRMPPSSFRGYDAEHCVENVSIEGLFLDGIPVKTLAEARVKIGDFSKNIALKHG